MKHGAILFSLLAAAPAGAASITYAGSVENNTVNEWRTASTAKPMDLDGDNIYGTHGAFHWLVASTGEFAGGSASPGWAYGGGNTFGQFRDPVNYAQIDTLGGGPDSGAGIMAVQFGGTFVFEMTGTAATYAGRTLRIGFMADVLSPADCNWWRTASSQARESTLRCLQQLKTSHHEPLEMPPPSPRPQRPAARGGADDLR